jgi:hypothetical protein
LSDILLIIIMEKAQEFEISIEGLDDDESDAVSQRTMSVAVSSSRDSDTMGT